MKSYYQFLSMAFGGIHRAWDDAEEQLCLASASSQVLFNSTRLLVNTKMYGMEVSKDIYLGAFPYLY